MQACIFFRSLVWYVIRCAYHVTLCQRISKVCWPPTVIFVCQHVDGRVLLRIQYQLGSVGGDLWLSITVTLPYCWLMHDFLGFLHSCKTCAVSVNCCLIVYMPALLYACTVAFECLFQSIGIFLFLQFVELENTSPVSHNVLELVWLI